MKDVFDGLNEQHGTNDNQINDIATMEKFLAERKLEHETLRK